jgi:signal transduction histidine kinase
VDSADGERPEDARDAESGRLLWALRERIKELTALHSAARFLLDTRKDPALVLSELTGLLPPAWQYPEQTEARIRYGDLEARTPGFRETPWRQAADFKTDDGRSGLIEVVYVEPKPLSYEGPFLKEERALIQSLAQMLESYFQRRTAEDRLVRARDRLELEVQDRTAELVRANESLRAEVEERKQTEAVLEHSQTQLRRLASELALTEEKERRAIACDLHDHLGQALALVRARLGQLRGNAVFSGADADIEEMRLLLDEAIRYTRSLTIQISPPVLFALGFEPALAWLADRFRAQHGLRVELRVEGTPSELPEDIRITLFRSVQELLRNTVQHAQANRAEISLVWSPERLDVTVRDDGRGFKPAEAAHVPDSPGKFGLFSIRERMKALGGQLTFSSAPRQGASLTLNAPLNAARPERTSP